VKRAIRTPSPLSSLMRAEASGRQYKNQSPPFSSFAYLPRVLVVYDRGRSLCALLCSSCLISVSSRRTLAPSRDEGESTKRRGIRGAHRDTLRRCKCTAISPNGIPARLRFRVDALGVISRLSMTLHPWRCFLMVDYTEFVYLNLYYVFHHSSRYLSSRASYSSSVRYRVFSHGQVAMTGAHATDKRHPTYHAVGRGHKSAHQMDRRKAKHR
jgi:hypothetical protein